MKPFKKRKIFIEPPCRDETIHSTESKKILFPYETQSFVNVSELIQTLTKNLPSDDLKVWKQVTLRFLYIRKSFPAELRTDHDLNRSFIERVFLKYFDCLMRSDSRSDNEMDHFLLILMLFFEDSPEEINNFLMFCDTKESTNDLLLRLLSKCSFTNLDETPSYTRLIIILQKMIHGLEGNYSLKEIALEHLPERVPFSSDIHCEEILKEMCPDSEMTRDILKTPFNQKYCDKLKEVLR